MTQFSVPDMSCGHCKAAIETALTPLFGPVSVDLPARAITLQGTPDTAAVLATLSQIGFPAQVLAKSP